MDHLAALKAANVALTGQLAAAELAEDAEAIGNLSWEQMRIEDRISRIERRLARVLRVSKKVRKWA